jgi:hypothetical protein
MRMSHDPTRRPAHGQLGKSAAIVTAYEEEREGWGKICMGCSGWARLCEETGRGDRGWLRVDLIKGLYFVSDVEVVFPIAPEGSFVEDVAAQT